MIPKFDAKSIWSAFLGEGITTLEEKPTIFMGVPTMYTKLLAHYDTAYANNTSKREYVRAACSNNLRLKILNI